MSRTTTQLCAYRGVELVWIFVWFAIGIYPGAEGVEVFRQELEERKLKYSKGAIQFQYDNVDLELIERIAKWCGRDNCG